MIKKLINKKIIKFILKKMKSKKVILPFVKIEQIR